MSGTAGGVRVRRKAPTVAVTGAAGPLGRLVGRRLVDCGEVGRVVGVDTTRAPAAGITWRLADVRDPALRTRFTGVDTVVHLASNREADAAAGERRVVNVSGTDTVLSAAAATGVSRVVLVTSAMVYGALPDNAVPLADSAPLRAQSDSTLVGDWVEMERVAAGAHPSVGVICVRPASVVGGISDPYVPRLFDAPRLLLIKDSRPLWQFCHVDDLVSAIEWAALGRTDASITVGCDGWLRQAQIERISGMRSVQVSESTAIATAERLHRVGVLPAPASELQYLANPWVIGSDRLRASGWRSAWDNESALRAYLDERRYRSPRVMPRTAGRAAAGATVALVGTLAVVRARASRRRRRG